MNTQRWLALLVVGGIVTIIVTRPLWIQAAQDQIGSEARTDGEPLPTPAPYATPTQGASTEGEPAPSPQAPPTEGQVTGETMMEAPGMGEAVETNGTPESASGPFILAKGNFVQLDAVHGGEGTATIYQAPDGSRFVRLEPFSVTDAPDLRVALSSHPAPRTQNDLATSTGFIDLGRLESNQGAQNYDIPLTVRLEQFESVVIYDKQFNIIFTTATLEG